MHVHAYKMCANNGGRFEKDNIIMNEFLTVFALRVGYWNAKRKQKSLLHLSGKKHSQLEHFLSILQYIYF